MGYSLGLLPGPHDPSTQRLPRRVTSLAAISHSAKPSVQPGPIAEIACWSHARRLYFDVYDSNGSPIAKEALERIGVLFDIERPIAGKPPDVRRQVRAQLAKPRLDELAAWLDQQLQRIPGRSELAKAIRYARSRCD